MYNREMLMVRPDLANLPAVAMPAGFAVRPYAPGDEAVWTAIWGASEPFDLVLDEAFRDSLGHDDALLAERVYLLVDETTGRDVGTVTAWTEPRESRRPQFAGWGRVHWLAVLPEYQGRGLGKALLAYCLHRLREFGHGPTFLVTSSGRTGAVRLYESFGFKEYHGDERVAE